MQLVYILLAILVILLNKVKCISLQEKDNLSLNMIPSEMVSKMAQVMNQNSENIIQQKLNIKEINEENKHIEQKASELVSGQKGLEDLEGEVEGLEKSVNEIGEKVQRIQERQAEQVDTWNQQLKGQLEHKANRMEDFIVRDGEGGETSRWGQQEMFNNHSTQVIQQHTQQSEWKNKSEEWSLLLHPVWVDSQHYLFTGEFYVNDYAVYALIYDHRGYMQHLQIVFTQTYQARGIYIQRVNGDNITLLKQVDICNSKGNNDHYLNNYNQQQQQQQHDSEYYKHSAYAQCLQLEFNHWHSFSIYKVSGNTIVLIDDQLIYSGEESKHHHQVQVGLASVFGNAVYYKQITVKTILFNPNILSLIQQDTLKNYQSQKLQEYQQQQQQQQQYQQQQQQQKQKNLKSIELVKQTCMKMGGSQLSCTAAMVAFDQLLSSNQQLTKEKIQQIIYQKCIKIKNSQDLACKIASKTALQVALKQ